MSSKIVNITFIVLGLILIGTSFFYYIDALNLKNNSIHIEGTVIQNKESYQEDYIAYAPVIEYVFGGQKQTYTPTI